jgi:hypothetical protein
MAIDHCYICAENPTEARRLGPSRLLDGRECPLCHRPTCRYHLVTVRWRWRRPDRALDSTQICRECHRTYQHRNWDTINRDWIS